MREPLDRNTEGCGIADWIMLSLELGDVFDEPELFESAEIALHNALAHVQASSGHFGCETLTDDPGLLVVDYVPEAWWCCTFHCFKALHQAAIRAIEYREGEGLVINLILPVEHSIAGLGVVAVRTDYPASQFGVEVETPTAMPVRVRASRFRRLESGPSQGGFVDLPASRAVSGACTTWIDVGGLPLTSLELNITDEFAPWAGVSASIFVGPRIQTLSTPASGGGDVVAARTIVLRAEGARMIHEDDRGRARVRGLVREFSSPWSLLATAPGQPLDATQALTRFRFAGIARQTPELP